MNPGDVVIGEAWHAVWGIDPTQQKQPAKELLRLVLLFSACLSLSLSVRTKTGGACVVFPKVRSIFVAIFRQGRAETHEPDFIETTADFSRKTTPRAPALTRANTPSPRLSPPPILGGHAMPLLPPPPPRTEFQSISPIRFVRRRASA